jgi:dUTP pyrophosphatase
VAFDIPVRRLDPDLPLPGYARPDDAGLDLLARESVELAPGGGRARVPTGLAVAIPPGWAGFVQPRSGLAARHGVTCLNSPGLIDAGFRGELAVLLVNHDPVEPFVVGRGDRVAQLVVQRVESVRFVVTDELPDSALGEGGWGHSGVTDAG